MPLEPETPVLAGTYPDPSVCRVGDDYYLVTSTFEYFPGLPIFHSTDLRSWTQIGHAIHRLDQLALGDVPSSGGLYAPTLRHHDGVFYLVCTVVGGSEKNGNFLITATDPAGPWSDPIWFDDAAGFDPSLVFDGDRCWYTGTRLAAEPAWHQQAEIWLREVDLDAGRLIGPEHVLWTGALDQAIWAEGPHLYQRNGWWYLLAAEGGTAQEHAISVARSREIVGPYTGFARNPVFTHRHLGRQHPIVAAGHADLIEGPDGEWWAFLLAVRTHDGEEGPMARETFATSVDWEDDWPVFARGVGQLARVDGARRLETQVAIPDPLAWTQVRSARRAGRVDGDTIWLSPGAALTEVGTPAFVGRRQTSLTQTLAATVPDGVGLAARQSEHDHLLFSSDGVVQVRDGVAQLVAEVGSATRLELRVDGYRYDCVADGRLVASVDGRYLTSRSASAAGRMSFVGVWLGVFSTVDVEAAARDVRFD